MTTQSVPMGYYKWNWNGNTTYSQNPDFGTPLSGATQISKSEYIQDLQDAIANGTAGTQNGVPIANRYQTELAQLQSGSSPDSGYSTLDGTIVDNNSLSKIQAGIADGTLSNSGGQINVTSKGQQQYQSGAIQSSSGQTLGGTSGTTTSNTPPADDPSNKYNTLTGKLNPNYNGTQSAAQIEASLTPAQQLAKGYVYNTQTGERLTPDTSNNSNSSSNGSSNTATPAPKPTGNSTLDSVLNSSYQYVTGNLAQGWSINPALSGSNLANMLPQFIQQVVSEAAPEMQQNFQQEMAGVNTSLQNLQTNYTASQGRSIYDFQTSLANLLNTSNPFSAMTGAGANAMANNENRTLSALDATYAANVGNTLQQAGAQLGQGVPNINNGNGQVTQGGLSPGQYSASSLSPLAVNPLQVGILGGNTVLGGSTQAGNALNYNFNPSTYTYGAIPTSYGSTLTTNINKLFGQYQAGAAAQASPQTGSGITSSTGLTL